MTLKLVADNTVALPRYNPKLIPSIARTFADKVEDGEFGEVSRAVVILETDAGPIKFYWGERMSHLEAVGLLHLASIAAAGDAFEDFEE
jgi:hypothetical protein